MRATLVAPNNRSNFGSHAPGCGDRPWILDSPFTGLNEETDPRMTYSSLPALTWYNVRTAALEREELWLAILHSDTVGGHRHTGHLTVVQ